MTQAMHSSGGERRWGAYDQRVWRDERRHGDRSGGDQTDGERGRSADKPSDIPRRGWRDIALRVKDKLGQDRISIIAAAVAFYGLLAIFPALAALVAIYGLVADPQQVESQVAALSAMLPSDAADILTAQLHDLVQTDEGALRAGAIIGILLALWSAASGVRTLMEALNVAYHEDESRGTVKLYGTSLLLTFAAIVGVVLLMAIIVAVPLVATAIGLGSALESAIAFARWPVAAVAAIFFLAVMYRFGPSRQKPRWRWVSWGAVVAMTLWIAGSALFSFYVTRFGNYNETYGSMGAVVILLTWFLLSAYAVLIGAEINSEMERQTRKDTTAGEGKPMGSRARMRRIQ